jgi:hypothetical protein
MTPSGSPPSTRPSTCPISCSTTVRRSILPHAGLPGCACSSPPAPGRKKARSLPGPASRNQPYPAAS